MLVIGAMIVNAIVHAVHADDWPRFRGISTQGVSSETNVPLKRGAEETIACKTPWDQAYVLALDAKTGKERWQGKRGMSRISHGAPCIREHDGQTQVVTEAGDVVQGFDLKTGKRLWSSPVTGEGKVPSAVVGEGLVFTSGGWGGKESIKAFKLGGQGDLQESNLVWQHDRRGAITSGLYFWEGPYSVSAEFAAQAQGVAWDVVRKHALSGVAGSAPNTPSMELGGNFWNIGWHKPSDCFVDWQNVQGDNPWNPQFLKDIAIYKSLRFMDWDNANNSGRSRWAERNRKDSPKQNPVAYEWMIDLCNRMNADLWVALGPTRR